MKQICWILLAACLSSVAAHSQTPNDPLARRQEEIDRQRRESDLQNRRQNLEKLKQDALKSQQEALIIARTDKPSSETKEQRTIIKETLSPNPDDSTKYKTFLKQSNTGLFRLFPDFDCESKRMIVKVDGNCENLIPGTQFYSFRQKNYSNDTLFDIRLRNENLIIGGFLSQGILVQLGDIPLEEVSLASGGMKFLVDFKPEMQNTEIKKQFLQIAKGTESNGYIYRKTIKASENTTYAMRVIAYHPENKPVLSGDLTAETRKLWAVRFDKRKDLILAFRIIRKEADGNITILWRELARKDAPKIVFQKNAKITDINEVIK